MLGIVPGFSVDTPSSGSGPIDPTAFRNAALMKGRVGEAAGSDVANLFQQVADQVQDARNAKKVFDADLSLNKTKDQFLIDIQKDPALASDPGKWVPEYKQRIEQTTQAIMGQENLGPAVKRHLSMMTQNFAQQSTTDVQMNALHRETEDTKQSGFEAATQTLASGAPDSVAKATVIYKSLLEAGVIGPKVADQLIKQAPGVAAEGMANTAITTDPINAPETIKKFEGIINPRKMETIQKLAAEAKSRAQRENINDISERMQNDPLRSVSPDFLKAQVDSKQITQAQADGLLARMKRNDAEEDKAFSALASAEITDHDWVADNTPQKTANDMAARINEVQNPGERNRLTKYMEAQMKAAKKEGKSIHDEIHQTQLDLMRQAHDESMSRILITPQTDGTPARRAESVEAIERMDADKFVAEFGDDADRKTVLKTAREFETSEKQRYAKAQKQYLDWTKTKKGAEATPQQAADERERLGFGRYSSTADVAASFKAGKIDATTAKEILHRQFGIP